MALLNPASVIVTALNGQTVESVLLASGTNLFAGELLPEPSARVVFVLNTGGPAPEPIMASGNIRRSRVQLLVRGAPGKLEEGEAFARGLLEWLHRRELAGFFSCLAGESQPVYLGRDEQQRPGWSLNFQVWSKEG